MEPCGEEEVRRFLEKLYQDTGGDNWRFQENWCTDKPLSEWGSSVKYEDGKLSLILGENNLHGKSTCRVYGFGVASLREKFADGD